MTFDIDSFLGNLYNIGGLVAIDNAPPFMIRFDWFPEDFTEDFSAEYDFAGYPGARHQFPIFKNMTPRTITFTAKYDISNRNTDIKYLDLNTTVPDMSDSVDVGGGKKFLFKGANKTIVNTAQLLGADYINMVRSLYEKLVLPKYGLSKAVQTAAGKILNVSQGATDPSPPLTLLIKNINKMYLGYMSEAKAKELNTNSRNFCTRIEFACKFLVTPDLIFSSIEEVIREVNVVKSLAAVF